MATMNISMPDTMRDYVEGQLESKGYASVSEYMRSLVREQQRQEAQDRLDALLLEGLDSGPAIPVTPEYWSNLKARLHAEAPTIQQRT